MEQKNKGITLIALVITIIVLLILAAVSIATLTGENGILTKSQEAKLQNTKSQTEEEAKLAVASLLAEEATTQMTQEEKRVLLENELKQYDSSATVAINGTGFLAEHRGYEAKIDEQYKVSVKEPFNAEEWDKTAAPEDVFIWQSDDPNDEGYGVVIGYTANAENYTTLRFPSRCTKITFAEDLSYEGINTTTSRAYTNNILKVEIPATTKEIGAHAFGYATTVSFKELKEVIIEEGLEKIGGAAFSQCTNLTNVTIPDSVISLGAWPFGDTPWFNNQPDGVMYVGKVAYCYKGTMPSNTSIKLKEGTTEIAGWGFYYNPGLTSITIPDSVTSIGDNAFGACSGLTSVTIPDSVTSIGENAFSSSKHIYYNGTATGSPWGALAIN